MFQVKKFTVDKIFLIIVGMLLGFGLLIFLSASLTLLGAESSQLFRLIGTQVILGLFGGILGAYLITRINITTIKKMALPFALLGVFLTILVYFIGWSSGGAARWISIGGFISFQPSEILKYGLVIYYAAFLSFSEKKSDSLWYSLVPLLGIIGLAGAILLPQPDTDSVMIIAITCTIMYFVAEGKISQKIKHIGVLFAIALVAGGALIASRPYLLNRLTTFLNPSHDPLNASYQIQQSLIAVGSGELTGRGFGQSIQKFKYLPEPLSDSIYAVMAEEFGFVGSVGLIILYIAFALRGYIIATKTHDPFSRYLVVGIITIIISQSFLNIASTIGLFPLSGLPLIFVSHGGTALLFSLLAVGLVLNVSQYQKTVAVPVKKLG